MHLHFELPVVPILEPVMVAGQVCVAPAVVQLAVPVEPDVQPAAVLTSALVLGTQALFSYLQERGQLDAVV